MSGLDSYPKKTLGNPTFARPQSPSTFGTTHSRRIAIAMTESDSGSVFTSSISTHLQSHPQGNRFTRLVSHTNDQRDRAHDRRIEFLRASNGPCRMHPRGLGFINGNDHMLLPHFPLPSFAYILRHPSQIDFDWPHSLVSARHFDYTSGRFAHHVARMWCVRDFKYHVTRVQQYQFSPSTLQLIE